MIKKRKWLITAGVLVLLIIFAVYIYKMKPKDRDVIEVATKRYDATNEINKAMKRLKENKKAEIVSDIKTLENMVSLTFSGLSDPKSNEKIIDLLSKYNRKATFFIPGIGGAEDTNTINAIYLNEHNIGSNTLTSQKHMEERSKEELLIDFTTTSHIIESLVNVKPTMVLCNSTEYTEEVLSAAYASGYDYVLDSNHFLSYQSFTSYEQVKNYINNLSKGSIITIKLDGVLDELEYEIVDKDEQFIDKEEGIDNQAAFDKQATIDNHADIEEFINLRPEDRLIKIVEWILIALDEAEYQSLSPHELKAYYDSDFDITFDDIRKSNGGKLSKVYKKINTDDTMMAFSFRGMKEDEILDKLLALLSKNRIKTTFFVTGEEIINNPNRIHEILDAGHHVENGGMTGKDLTQMDFNEVSYELYKCGKLLKEIYGIESKLFMPVYGKYNDTVLEAASSLGYHVVTYNKNPIVSEDQSIDEVMDYYKNGFNKGEIIFFRLDLYKDIVEIMERTLQLLDETNYKIYDIKRLLVHDTGDYVDKNIQYVQGSESNIKPITSIGTIIEKDSITDQMIEELRKKNNNKKANIVRTVYTTEKSLSFTFYGISNTEVLFDVLDKLDRIGGKGTFFVTEKDIKNNQDSIKRIAIKGHELGICLSINNGSDYKSITRSILFIQDEVMKLTGKKPTLVRYPYEVNLTDEMLEGIASTGCTAVWQDISIATSKLGKEATLDEVIKATFHAGNLTVKRGYIIYFRMDYYNDKELIGNTLMNIYKNRIQVIAYNDDSSNKKSSYSIKTLGAIMEGNQVYSYPVLESSILDSVKEERAPGYLDKLSQEELFYYMQGRYIGTPTISNQATLPGFHDMELAEMNSSGRFTDDKVLFLTFDDWGSDKTINQLLYVLKKYNVYGTFYARTNYIEHNPNLLRAIAEEGHDVGSHSDEHNPFALSNSTIDEIDTSIQYYSLTKEDILLRSKDLTTSYNKLKSIIGDIEIDGLPALTKTFRPPTLAMSKEGIHTILDSGFSYIVSGDFSSHDYEDSNPSTLVDKLLNGLTLKNGSKRTLQNGSVIILHMSDDNINPSNKNDVTAEALDILIPKLLEQGYRFAKISEYLNDDSGEVYSVSEKYTEWFHESKNLEE